MCHQLFFQELDCPLLPISAVLAQSYLSLTAFSQQLTNFIKLLEILLFECDEVTWFN